VFFEAKALTDHAADMAEKKEGIDQAISSVTTAVGAIEAIEGIVGQMKGLTIGARTASGSELASLVEQFNDLRTQIDNLASDATYQGLNLVNGTATQLTVRFSNDTASVLVIDGVDLRASSTGLAIGSVQGSVNGFSVASNIEASLDGLDDAVSTLRGAAKALGSNVALLQTRLDFTKDYVNLLEGGAGKLTLADINEEGANLVALQTRQQLGISALAFAGQSEQSVLALFN
jgi:flagellin-like hook-associated protein FlgL